MIYNDYKLPFDGILEDNKQESIHKKRPVCHQEKQI